MDLCKLHVYFADIFLVNVYIYCINTARGHKLTTRGFFSEMRKNFKNPFFNDIIKSDSDYNFQTFISDTNCFTVPVLSAQVSENEMPNDVLNVLTFHHKNCLWNSIVGSNTNVQVSKHSW